MLKVGVVIVTYNPDLNVLRSNLLTLIEQAGSNCLIVDNGSKNLSGLKMMAQHLEVHIISLEKNLGIAYAQNRGFEFFEGKDVEWVLTLDQDSLIPDNLIKVYSGQKELQFWDTAILTCSYQDKDWTPQQKSAMSQREKIEHRKYVISSGNLVRLSAWKKVNGFDEFLFIDLVDFDFDAKLFLAGYKIWQTNEVVLQHSVGKTLNKPIMQKLLLLPENAILADHSPMRQYYIYRNSIIFEKRYTMISQRNFVVLHTFAATRRVFAYSAKLSKMVAAWRGVIDGARYNVAEDISFQQTLANLRK